MTDSTCEFCGDLDDMLVQHPVNDSLMICIACYQDALEAVHDDIGGRNANETS